MKKHLRLISRFAVVAVATGGLCCGNFAFGQGKPREDATKEQPPEPGRVGSMAPVGAKPSKAELEKQKAEEAAKNGKTKPADAKSATAKPAAGLDMKDRAFVMEAAKGGMKEVEMGKMAAKQAKSAEVKNLGKMIAADHAKANKELMALAKAKGVKLEAPARMAKMSDANFDSAYLDQMVKDHQKDIAAFERAAKNSKDADVKSWAAKTLPTLKKHLAATKQAQGSMKKAM